MLEFNELKIMPDEELLKLLDKQGDQPAGSVAGAEQSKNRDLIKAILDVRSFSLTKQQSDIMIKLTRAVYILTLVMVILTFVSIIK